MSALAGTGTVQPPGSDTPHTVVAADLVMRPVPMDGEPAISVVLVAAAAGAVVVVLVLAVVVVVGAVVVAVVVVVGFGAVVVVVGFGAVVVVVVVLGLADTMVTLRRCLADRAAAVSRVVSSAPVTASLARVALSDWPPPQAVSAINELNRVRAWAARGNGLG